MNDIRYWMSLLTRYQSDPRMTDRGRALYADLLSSLTLYVEHSGARDLADLLDRIDHDMPLPYHIADHVTDRILWTLIRTLESMLPPTEPSSMSALFAELQSANEGSPTDSPAASESDAADHPAASASVAATPGERLAAVRKSRHLTQAQLATLVGTTPAQISNWETNYRRPSSTSLAKLTTALSCSPSDLL